MFDGGFLLVGRMLTGAMGNLLPPSLNAVSGFAVPTKVLWVQQGGSPAVGYGNSCGEKQRRVLPNSEEAWFCSVEGSLARSGR